MEVKLTFTEPLLGTLAANEEIAKEFIMSNHPEGPQKDELHTEFPEGDVQKASTIFARDKCYGKPHLWDYQIKGFFKDACLAMIHTDALTKEELKKIRLTQYLYRRSIDKLIFVCPRQIFLELPNNDNLKFCERPLRGETMRGERISLARSEMAPKGTSITIEITTLNPKLDKFVKQWLDYGQLNGLGQWRNSGMGRFSYEILKSE